MNAIIIDDEFLARENLKLLIEDFCEGITIVGTASNIVEGKELIASKNPDLVFLDIRMPSGAEGFDLLDSLQEIDFEVVFVTAFKDFAIRAFKANAIDYILKPVEIEELQTTVSRILKLSKRNISIDNKKEIITNAFDSVKHREVTRIAISHQRGIKLFEVADIVHLQSHSNYTELHFVDCTKFVDSRTLKVYQEILSQSEFMRVHNSHIVNLGYIKEYISEDGNILVMQNGEQVPISRSNLPRVIAFLKSQG